MSSPLATLEYLRQVFSNAAYAVVSGSGLNLTISAEITPTADALALPTLIGATGAAGGQQFALHYKPAIYTSPTQLPTDLTNTAADIGKFWLISQVDTDGNVISSAAYIWWGAEFRKLNFGTQGPPGTYPVINPTITLLDSDDNSDFSNVTGSGTAASPYHYAMELAIPDGPAGPASRLGEFQDVAYPAGTPTLGQALTYAGNTTTVGMATVPLWQPTSAGDSIPSPYTVPESAFSSYVGLDPSTYHTVGTFKVPPQPWDWKPCVWGQIAVVSVELSLTPLQIGVEVRLGSPDPNVGTLVARGFGNSLGGIVTLVPHTSSPSSPSTKMTPSNSVAKVVANHTGVQGTLYVNLVNDGLLAAYDFNAQNSQLFVMAVPTSTEGSLMAGAAAFRSKTTFSATAITHGS